MKPYRIPIAAAVRLLATLMTLAAVTSCHSRSPVCLVQDCDPFALEGTLSGLVGSGLLLVNNSQQPGISYSGTGANGTQVVFGAGYLNAPYNLTIQRQPTS